MNQESPWKKNLILNIGLLISGVGMLTLTFFDKAQALGTVIALAGLAMFFVGYRKAKASGTPPIPANERQRKLRFSMVCVVASFLVSPIVLWPQISRLHGPAIWIFVIGDIICLSGILGFYVWLYKKAGQDKTDGI